MPGEELCTLRNVDRYGDYMRYPFDVADGPLDEVVHAAARSEEPIAEWQAGASSASRWTTARSPS